MGYDSVSVLSLRLRAVARPRTDVGRHGGGARRVSILYCNTVRAPRACVYNMRGVRCTAGTDTRHEDFARAAVGTYVSRVYGVLAAASGGVVFQTRAPLAPHRPRNC